MMAARRSAREALSDMAQQNARLVSAYVEKKQELRHLQDNIREERLQWQVILSLDTPMPSFIQYCVFLPILKSNVGRVWCLSLCLSESCLWS